jgi:hypothetical protein
MERNKLMTGSHKSIHQRTFTPEQWQGVEVKVADNGPATPTTEVKTNANQQDVPMQNVDSQQ